MILTLLLAEPVCVCVYVKYPACCKNYTFSCGLDSAAHVHVLHACVFVYVCKCVFLCGSVCILLYSWQCETPALPARCACAHVFVSVRLCVCARETDRQDSPMGSMLSLRKADYGTCQGVRNTPHQHYTDSQLSTHLYGCDCKAQSLLLPPAIWRPGQVLPPQLDMKLDSYCPYIF